MSTSSLPVRGEVASLLPAQDWASTPLGDPTGWPPTLRTVATLVLNAPRPMYLVWGPGLTLLYTDAYRSLLGDRHPGALGQPLPQVWPEIWQCIGPLHQRALQGEAAQADDVECTVRRGAQDAQAWFSASCSPVHDGDRVAGVLCLID